jgi:hypothetical protein
MSRKYSTNKLLKAYELTVFNSKQACRISFKCTSLEGEIEILYF